MHKIDIKRGESPATADRSPFMQTSRGELIAPSGVQRYVRQLVLSVLKRFQNAFRKFTPRTYSSSPTRYFFSPLFLESRNDTRQHFHFLLHWSTINVISQQLKAVFN